MKVERYIVEIEMPDGDMASSAWVCDTLQTDSDIEDEGRWKVSVKEYWKPSDEQIIELRRVISGCSYDIEPLVEIVEQLKKLREE